MNDNLNIIMNQSNFNGAVSAYGQAPFPVVPAIQVAHWILVCIYIYSLSF